MKPWQRKPSSTRLGRCPDGEEWIRFAAEIPLSTSRELLLEHAAECADCNDRLRSLIAPGEAPISRLTSLESEADFNADDEVAINALTESLEQRRTTLAREMAGMAHPVHPSFLGYRILAVAASITVAAGLAGWFVRSRTQSKPPFELLASAYSSRRTLELRVPGADYAPLRLDRGPNSLSDAPPALLESELLIQRHFKSRVEDPEWLHAQARAFLLMWQFDAALHSFEAAADLGANSAEFLVDYASAYYERAERNSSVLDYGLALEKLSLVLKDHPSDASALFNSGIIHAKLHQYDSAAEDFARCLQVHGDSQWKAEAQTRLDDARRLKGALSDPNRWVPARFRAERDLETAMLAGLDEFFRGSSSMVEQTARAMLEQHRDPWLRDVVALRGDPDAVVAIGVLTRMARMRIGSNPAYDTLATQIRWLAVTSLPRPLRVWRDYEFLARDARSSRVSVCGDHVAGLAESARTYPWMEAQILLESSVCRAAIQDFTGAAVLVDRAENLLTERDLTIASIRIPIFRAQRLVETGYFREAVQTASDGLVRMEEGPYPLRRAYDLHSVIMLAASQLNLPETGYGAARMMAWVGANGGLDLFEMIGLCRAAGFALSLGRREDASSALRSAETMLGRLGNNATARIYWRTSRIAWLESSGDVASLHRMLDEAHREGGTAGEDLFFNRKLIAAICRIEAQRGRSAQVEQMAERFWQDAARPAESAGSVQAFRPELESVSESLVTARIGAGDETGALQAWERFLLLDRQLLGGGATTSQSDSGPAANLTIAELGDKVGIWLQSGGDTKFHWVPESRAEFDRRIRRLARLANLGLSSRELSTDATALFHILFPTGYSGQVFVRARGLTNTIPLELFHLVDEGKSVEFSYLPFGGRPLRKAEPSKQFTMIAATSFDEHLGLPPLPDSQVDSEIEAVRASFPRSLVFRGPAATVQSIERAAVDSGIVHFTGHATTLGGGIALVGAPDPGSSIAGERAGLWSMGRPRTVNASLVVLSACSTGAFDDSATVQPGQMAVSMLLAGARQVIASMWDVDSAATATWNREFYYRIAAGDPTSTALAKASERVRSTPGWSAPKFWASFTLYGA